MSNGVQTVVNDQPAPAVAGDFASLNPRFTANFGPSGAVAGPNGVVVGRACWATMPPDGDGRAATISSSGSGNIAGIVAREQQGLITTYLANASMVIPQGFGVTVFSDADFWVVNDGAALAQYGQKAYANFSTGKFNFAATASASTGGSGSASTIDATTFSVTGQAINDVLAVTVVGSGTVYPGATISGSGITSGNKIVSQAVPLLAGEAYGGIGRYYLAIPEQNTASVTVSGTYGLLTVGGTVVAGFGLGQGLAATGSVVAGTTITAAKATATPALTGQGGAGTYVVDNNTGVTSQAISVLAVNVETGWAAVSSALVGELVKISRHLGS